jgi:hypothetical protein
MTTIKQSNKMFSKARRGDNKVEAGEAKNIARTLKKGGLTAAEKKTVSAQLHLYKDTFSAAASRTLGQLIAPRPKPATQGSAASSTAATSGNVVIPPNKGGTIEDKAAAALGDLKEPKFPGKDATEAELAQFQKDLGKYNRMYEMMSKVMANSHEMKKSLVGNLPRS